MSKQTKADQLLKELKLKRLEELNRSGKIKSIKDLCRHGFCPAILFAIPKGIAA